MAARGLPLRLTPLAKFPHSVATEPYRPATIPIKLIAFR
jgi:hypothetical protein